MFKFIVCIASGLLMTISSASIGRSQTQSSASASASATPSGTTRQASASTTADGKTITTTISDVLGKSVTTTVQTNPISIDSFKLSPQLQNLVSPLTLPSVLKIKLPAF